VYAVIEDSGSQFRVSEGDVLNVDLRELAEDTKEIEFDRVLLVSGEEVKGPKVHIYKLRRRKASRRKTGHRQKYVQVRVAKIKA